MRSLKRGREGACPRYILMAGPNSEAINSHTTRFDGERNGRARGDSDTRAIEETHCIVDAKSEVDK